MRTKLLASDAFQGVDVGRRLEGTHESVYEYDGASRRVRIKELTSSVETKNETFVWCGSSICQKRASNGTTVQRSYFGQGFEQSGPTDYFYTRDHLGSIREVVGSDGTTIASRLSYDPWGKATETGSGATSDFTYTGHYADRPTGLGLTWFRAYDPNLGRWISRDPIGLAGGLNLYGYVGNEPIGFIDPSGLLLQGAFVIPVIVIGAPVAMPVAAAGLTGGAAIGVGVLGGAVIFGEAALAAYGGYKLHGALGGGKNPLGLFHVQWKTGLHGDHANDTPEPGAAGGPPKGPCDIQYDTDLASCRAMTRNDCADDANRCYASAMDRKIACEKGNPIPPLHGWW